MFVYTVYPIPRRSKKKPVRQVEPVSRVKPIHRVEYDSSPIPLQPIRSIHGVTDSRNYTHDKTGRGGRAKDYLYQYDRKQQIDELYIMDALPLLLAWRRPRSAGSPDYIQKHHNRLRAIRSKHL